MAAKMRNLTRLALIGGLLILAVVVPSSAGTASTFPDTQVAGYFTSGLAPTSVSATLVVPSFTCTGVQQDIIQTGLTSTENVAGDEVLVNCSGSGQPAQYSTIVYSNEVDAAKLTVRSGDKVEMVLATTAATTLTTERTTMTDVTTGRTVKVKTDWYGSPNNASFTLSRDDDTTPTFTKATFSDMRVNGSMLTAATSFTQDMTSATSVIQVKPTAIVSGKGALVFKHS